MATWQEDIVSALENLGGSGSYDDIYAEVEHLRADRPPSWKEIVRREIQKASSDSAGFDHGDDLFFSVKGLRQGVWGLRSAVIETPAAVDIKEPTLPAGVQAPARAEQTTYRVLRDTVLARSVKLLHRDQCQLCGVALRVSTTQTYSEAHHIIPLGSDHNGPDIPENIIVLCPNHHALCDYGAIRLERSDIRVTQGHNIDDASLSYHNQKIYRAVV